MTISHWRSATLTFLLSVSRSILCGLVIAPAIETSFKPPRATYLCPAQPYRLQLCSCFGGNFCFSKTPQNAHGVKTAESLRLSRSPFNALVLVEKAALSSPQTLNSTPTNLRVSCQCAHPCCFRCGNNVD